MAADALTEHIKQAALDLGFSIVGISTFLSGHSTQDSAPNRELFPDQLGARLREWLRRGYQATMAWMARIPTVGRIPAMCCRAAVRSSPSA